MKTYLGLVHHDKDSAFGIHFPDVPGCFSAADTLEDLMAQAQEALALYFEDAEAIKPRDIDAVLMDDDVKKEQKAGAFVLMVPLIELSGRSERVNITIDSFLLKDIDQRAKLKGMNRSSYLAALAQKDLMHQGKVA